MEARVMTEFLLTMSKFHILLEESVIEQHSSLLF
jgi:hypothetical protein